MAVRAADSLVLSLVYIDERVMKSDLQSAVQAEGCRARPAGHALIGVCDLDTWGFGQASVALRRASRVAQCVKAFTTKPEVQPLSPRGRAEENS